MRLALLLPFACCLNLLSAQSTDLTVYDPDDILVAGDAQTKVLLFGTFHMDYPNLDAHVTGTEDQVDVTDAKRAAEMRELLDYLARFEPTKIVVERWPESNENDKYRAYRAGEKKLGKSEIEQIGYRLAKRFQHDSLILADAGTLVRSFLNDPELACLQPKLDSIYADWDFRSEDKISQRYGKMYAHDDELLQHNTLLDFMKYENSPKRILRGHGAYLHGDFELGNTRGQDALAMHWYARNLRIFRNIQRTSTSPEDRILVIFGAGHLGILRQQFESSPQFELIEFGDL
ncbi:DUF5694 domain-containing protein [Neolewinella antarctica]|uniref:TraB/GumN family protein n=1 Tax=Neolewinella antarctica TaxID=442734 RepID=A0ABX0XA48_9BACT|nr:DUF5694 domain-containing protein [Neolewinella antarctica]NJC25814.1 hypothetical protein [Neolewinella antarctica]